jgi:thiol:disulfide interchange protein
MRNEGSWAVLDAMGDDGAMSGRATFQRAARLAFCACALLFAAMVSVNAQGLPDKFDPARDASADLAAALATAKAQGKRVIVDVGGEWCSWCHILDRFFESNADALTLRNANYVWLKVNYSKQNTNAAFLARWPKVPGYPHLFVLSADGALIHSQDTGKLESGKGYDKAAVIAFLRRYSVADARSVGS